MEQTGDQIQAEIYETLGFIPPFFRPANQNPQVFANLWHQTLLAYLHNPLPALFKEKLSAYLSRFCAIPYCMICHSCALHALGVEARTVLQLLESTPPTEPDLEPHLAQLAVHPLEDLAQLEGDLGESLLYCAIYIALDAGHSYPCRTALQQFLGIELYQHLVSFIAYVKTCHVWMEANPEVAYQDDQRSQHHLQALIQSAPGLADFFTDYWERTQRDRQTWLEQQAAQQERRRNEALFRKVAEENQSLALAVASTSEGVLVTDPNQPDNPIIYVNPAFLRITGYALEDVLGQNCRFLQGPDTDRQVVEQIRQAIAHRQDIAATLLNYRKNGQPFWNELKIAPVVSATGELLYFIGIQADITERKQAEESLRQSESTLRSFFNSAPMMMGVVEITDYDIRHISDNAMAARWMGRSPASIDHQFASQLGIPQPYIDLWLTHYRKAEYTGQPVRFEYWHEFADPPRWLSATVSAIASEPGHPTRFAYVIEDISDRKQVAEALEHQRETLQKQAQLLDLAHDSILVHTLDGEILFWNASAEKVYGWTKEQAIGQSSHQFLKTTWPKPLPAIYDELLRQQHWEGELTHVRQDGHPIVVASRWALQQDKDGNPIAVLEINSDITEKKSLEAQFLRAQRMESIGTLAGGIAHDLNNILTPILSSAQLMLRQTSDDDKKRQQLLEIIQSSARRGATLIQQVLSFARGVEGKRTPLQMRHLASEIRHIAQETFPKSIELRLDLPRDLWLVAGDPTQLHQVLMNLCVNARDAMALGGTLTLKGENLWIDEHYTRMNLEAQPGPHILITVADTGCGISPENIERIFEPFFTTKELGKGTGLGLSTVLAIVKSHKGFVEVSSVLGQGTEFKVYLPAVHTGEAQPPPDDEAVPGHGELILVVDDEAAIRASNQASLEAYNYRVLTASDGIEAIALYAEYKQEVRLALVDLMMPSMDGPTAIRAFRKINPQVKVIAVSGLVSSSQMSTSVSSDIHAFLPKPYTAQELVKCIASVLNTP